MNKISLEQKKKRLEICKRSHDLCYDAFEKISADYLALEYEFRQDPEFIASKTIYERFDDFVKTSGKYNRSHYIMPCSIKWKNKKNKTTVNLFDYGIIPRWEHQKTISINLISHCLYNLLEDIKNGKTVIYDITKKCIEFFMEELMKINFGSCTTD